MNVKGTTWWKPFLVLVNAPAAQEMAVVKELKDAIHASNLFLQIWIFI